jgi:2,5-diamino-6-(ribosylamino)-4(3H)-pyrimidinone 5'-phosphate reductase
MKKPHISCVMMTSLDGRIQQKIWGLPEDQDLFEDVAKKIPWDAWIVGRVTMQGFTETKPRPPRRGRLTVPPGDFVADYDTKTFAVGLDPQGKLKFKSNRADSEHIISVVTARATAEHLDYLRSKNISYIIGGKRDIDLKLVVRKLAKLFPIKHLSVQGGGKINGSFLKAGLIDKLHVILMPLADGTVGTPTLFDVEEGYSSRRATHFRLKSSKLIKGGALLLKYQAAKKR